MKSNPRQAFVKAATNDACQSSSGSCPISNPGAINQTNMMPNTSNEPSEGQQLPLSTHRQMSSIPTSPDSQLPSHQKEGTHTWIYPSQQMFYNAMKRKGYQPMEQDMQEVVMLHNVVNERCWFEVMQWEALHCDKCPNPTLKSFQGKPKEYSLKARWNSIMGYKLPFDRHDWIVDRCGQEVRYIIDFYSGQPDQRSPVSMYLDTRPALDSVGSAWDRMVMSWQRFWQEEQQQEEVLRVQQMQNYNVVNTDASR
eukprot:TRINITY_DN53361_c0_g1_i2.p1 TRINITY_DN53361_c0_g1~~TRINITY_DN53361_c0_g1_i2.p1  ORF type:complete len:272 (-),score=19.20 TRINITY_DN53361_c0_g1_i2:360-1118(-)